MRSTHASSRINTPESVRTGASHPFRLLLALAGGAFVAAFALIASSAPGQTLNDGSGRAWLSARADTDSVAVDASLPDSSLADTTDAALSDSSLIDRYLQRNSRPNPAASIFQRVTPPLSPRLGNYWTHEIKLDSTGRSYIAREMVGREDVRYPIRLDLQQYRQERLRNDLSDNWRTLSEELLAQRRQQRRGGLGVNIVVPGGRQSAFSTIFGKPQVDLRVTGNANIQAGFEYRKSDQQVAFTGRASQTDPTFKQDLSLGIAGMIGDKLRVDVNWDTQSQFDYQNQLKLQYQGYEDEIIKSIEAGNVYLPTSSTLIRGGQSLFGIKTELQIGGVHLTTVASKQEGQANDLAIEGGSQTKEFEVKPTDYDENSHFFVAYYFRNRWEDALSEPSRGVVLYDGFERITDIEVWKTQLSSGIEENTRQAVALVDLGEPEELLLQADAFTRPQLPSEEAADQYDDAELTVALRNSTTPDAYLQGKGLSAADYQVGKYKLLREGTDYEVDYNLGYISLRQRLQENEALSVAFRYIANGNQYTVGDFSDETGGSSGGQNAQRLVLKLLRPVNLQPPALDRGFNPAAWYLELRNLYPLGGGGLSANNFDLKLYYEPPGKTPSEYLPGVGGRQTLLQLLGLDRLNESGNVNPDNQFDFVPGITIDPQSGLLIFPYLEPFGERIAQAIDETGGEDAARKKELYVFNRLYTEKRENAIRDTQHDIYRMAVASKGATQSFYDLGAYAGLIEGSVRVTSGGTPLQEGVDYTVDYAGGTVTITNDAFLTSGRKINITYEQNQFLNLQQKTLLGLRADYNLNDRLLVGSTIMRLNQKSPIDKFRIGEEPISNTIWGVDGKLDLEPRWLTRAIDFLPFIQTRAPSAISVTGEFAQLRPGNSQTIAFDQTRRDLQKQDRDFASDELSGISYIDDFEGFETTYSLKQPGAWMLSAPPDSIGIVDQAGVQFGADSLRTNWRANFAWYQLNANISDLLKVPVTPATARVPILEVYPNRDTEGETDQFLTTMDIYYNPRERGPYNYTTDFPAFFQNPASTWGGMTQRIPEGYSDFSQKNIEFVEFIFRPYVDNAQNDAGPGARLYVDLGKISEDIIPDQQLNTEDGLSLNAAGISDLNQWSRGPSVIQSNTIDIDQNTKRTEDLGLDGLASYNDAAYAGMELALERTRFSGFLDALQRDAGAISDPQYRAEVEKALQDPSGDDFYYFGNRAYYEDPRFYPDGGASLQQRFSRYFAGLELNSYEAQNKIKGEGPGNSRYPDTEDLNRNSIVDRTNSYYQYELPLSRTDLDALAAQRGVGRGDYVFNEIVGPSGPTGWYQVRIPVAEFTRSVGTIEGFTGIEFIRVWTTGHEAPVTLRFATLEMVGSQWQKSTDITQEVVEGSVTLPVDSLSTLTVSSVNNEENGDTYLLPFSTVQSRARTAQGSFQKQREQSMLLRVENLDPGRQRAVFRTFLQGIDLLKYERLRMFIHMHGSLGDQTDLAQLAQFDLPAAREKARIFVRLGANETNDYYEYEQPLTPSAENIGNSDQLWQTYVTYNGQSGVDLNSLNLKLGALNELKIARDDYTAETGFPTDSVFWSMDRNGNRSIGAPDVEAFAPPGTRIGIRGNPSLSKINTLVIGIRNPADPNDINSLDPARVLKDVTVWVNELRVSGYDQTNGWAGLLNADIRLADLGRFKATFQRQADGFGGLASTLDDRDQNAFLNWGVTTDLNVDKFIPERFGWTIPVSMQLQNNTSTPRFSPQRGDVRLDEILAQIESREDLTAAEKDSEKQEATEAAQTFSYTRSFTSRVQKSGSDSRLLRNTLDGISATYSYTDTDAHNPSLRLNDTWRWSGTLGYRLNVRRPRTVRPFWFLDALPLVNLLGDLRFNYAPQSISATGTAARNFSESQNRPNALRVGAVQDSSLVLIPEEIQFPLRQQQSFTHNRNYDIQYNPFQFLNLSLSANTRQNLNAIGVDTLFSVLALNPDLFDYETIGGIRLNQALAEGLIDSNAVDISAFEVERLGIVPTGRVLSRIFSGNMSPRPEQYDQRFAATFQPKFTQSEALDWITIQPVTYNATYGWLNGAVSSNTGANVRNQVDLRGGLTLRPQDFWRKFGFYKNLEEQQREVQQKKEAARQEREQEKQRRKEEAKRLKEEEALRKAEEKEETAEPKIEAEPEETAEPEVPEEEVRRMLPDTVQEEPALQEPETVAEGEQAEEPQEDEEASGGGFRLPLPSPVGLLRQTVLALTGIRDFNVTYTGSRTSTVSSVGQLYVDEQGRPFSSVHYSLYDAFRGLGPSIGYRFGLTRQISPFNRVLDPSLQIADVLTDAHKIQARTTISPSNSLTISLNWNTDWTTGQNYTYRPGVDEQGNLLYDASGVPVIASTLTERGGNRSSIWAFGASYQDLFQRQYETFQQDYNNAADPGQGIGDENRDGRVVLTNESVVADFNQTFVSGFSGLDSRNLLPFPMPSWAINYSGIANWPIIRSLVQGATLRHGYSADYSADYNSNLVSAADPTSSFTLQKSQQTIRFALPDYKVSAVRVNERYQPLIGVDLSLKNRVTTNIQWNKSNTYSLSTTNNEVSEIRTDELSVTASFQKQGMRIPFIPGKRLNNRIGLSLTATYSENSDLRYYLTRAMDNAVSNPDFQLIDVLTNEENRSINTENTRLTLSPKLSYTFSNRVAADFTVRYEKYSSKDSRYPSYTNMSGNFNVRVSISN